MRERPPDRKPRAPGRLPAASGPIRCQHLRQFTHGGHQPQQDIVHRAGSRRSFHGIAAQLRDDSTPPIKLRVFALQAAHRLVIASALTLDSERRLRRLHSQRRRALAARGMSHQ